MSRESLLVVSARVGDFAWRAGGAIGRLEREEETRARLEKGELGLDLYGFRERLGEIGVRWVDALDE